MPPTFKTKSYTDSISLKEDGERYPQDKNVKRISKEEYIKRFNDQISKDPKALELIDKWHNEDSNTIITLLCKYKNGDFCHRHLIKKIIEEGSKRYFTRKKYDDIVYQD